MTKQKNREYNKKHHHSKKGLLGRIYASQKRNSKKRGHKPPTYTLDELREAVIPMELFDELFDAWVKSNYEKMLAPSLDRIDDSIGYTEDNIQLMTWTENRAKQSKDRKSGKQEGGGKTKSRKVEQFTLDEEYIATYHSIQEVSRNVNISPSNIMQCCKGKRKSAGKFKWQYGEIVYI